MESQDGFQYLAIARRMYYDKSFKLPPEKFPDDNIHMSATDEIERYSPTGLGYSLALLPAVIGEDIFLRLSGTERISAFPLDSDWPVLLLASMTNAFFGALLVVVLYVYLRSYEIKHGMATLLAFMGVVATNLFVYTKHVYPHMMFASFLTAAFLGVRLYALTKKRRWLVMAGAAYGVVVLSYNQTYLLPAPILALYYLLSCYPIFDWLSELFRTKSKQKNKVAIYLTALKKWFKKTKPSKLRAQATQTFKRLLWDGLAGIVGLLPFWLLYSWFNAVRFSNVLSAGYGAGIPVPEIPFPYIIFEGIWGVLFSPGRSIFVYSPILLALFLFWWKLNKKFLPEFICFGIMTVIYVIFFGTLTGSPTFMVWHGEMSWGNRYMTPILPLLWVLLASIFVRLRWAEKWLVFIPLVLLGLYVQVIGLLLPYQIKNAGLPHNLYITGDKETASLHYNYGEYPNFLPRFSAVFTMSKTLFKRLKALPQMYNHGEYDLRLYDGVEAPFNIGWTVWRGLRPIALMSFDKKPEQSISDITLLMRNHVMDQNSSHSAQLVYMLNNQPLPEKTTITPNTEIVATLSLPSALLQENDNILRIDLAFEATSSAWIKERQVVFLQGLNINGQPQSIATMDYPYISPISQSLFGSEYVYWGGAQKYLWDIWHVHSRVFENTFDLWWLRPLHYWDMPKSFFGALFVLDVSGILYFGWLVVASTREKKQ